MASGLHRSLCIRPQVFHACLKLLKMLLTQYIPKHKLGKLETAHCVERTLPALLARTGDSSSRLRVAACNFIQVRAPSRSSAVLRPAALSSQKRCSAQLVLHCSWRPAYAVREEAWERVERECWGAGSMCESWARLGNRAQFGSQQSCENEFVL